MSRCIVESTQIAIIFSIQNDDSIMLPRREWLGNHGSARIALIYIYIYIYIYIFKTAVFLMNKRLRKLDGQRKILNDFIEICRESVTISRYPTLASFSSLTLLLGSNILYQAPVIYIR